MIEEVTIDGVPFMAARQAAALVGMSPDYLTRWCREGLVEARRVAGAYKSFMNSDTKHILERVRDIEKQLGIERKIAA